MPDRPPAVIDHPSPNFGDRRGRTVDTLVIHYTGMKSAAASLERLSDPAAEVSAHYLIDEDGTLYAMVAEQDRAWHAGVGFWRGETDLNSVSIGIELQNPGHEWGYRPFPDAQITALIGLCQGILARHAIPAVNVIGHSDLAPRRKADPGELFPWKRLAEAGIGLWPGEFRPAPADFDLHQALTRIGYDISDPEKEEATLRCIQHRFLPSGVNREADRTLRDVIYTVAALYDEAL